MHLVESSNTDVSGASEVSQSRGKLFLLESPTAVFLIENPFRLPKCMSIGIQSEYYVSATEN